MKDQIDSKTEHCDHPSAPALNSAFNEGGSRVTHPASEIQQSINPLVHAPTPLRLFTQPETLRQIGPARLDKFLKAFGDTPESPLPALPAAEDEHYLHSLAALFANLSLLPG